MCPAFLRPACGNQAHFIPGYYLAFTNQQKENTHATISDQ